MMRNNSSPNEEDDININQESGMQDPSTRSTESVLSQNGILLHYNNAGRFPKWIALATLSLVAWLATLGGVQRHQMDTAEKWALAVTTLSLVFAILAVLCYVFARGMFMAELPEVVLAGVVIIIWASGLPVIMNPANAIAVGYTDYLNANLYFSSWLSFLSAIWIVGELAKEVYGMDFVGMASPVVKAKRGKWYALIATSLVVLGSSVRIFNAFPCSAEVMAKSPICRQTKFAISAGVIGTVFAIVATYFLSRGTFTHRSDWCSSTIMLIIWSFGLGFITFGQGPGQNIGNLYFATWGSFILSVLLAAESLREFMGIRDEAINTSTEDRTDMTDMPGEIGPTALPVQVQTMDDTDL